MQSGRLSSERGFSLVELLVALAIMGLVVAVVVPSSARFYESMQTRQAARATLSMLAAAREKALSSGRPQDVQVRPSTRRLWTADSEYTFPRSISVVVHGAAELNHADVGVIRFYPEGGSSGGGIDLRRANGNGTAVNVDWLVGRVTLEPLREG
jgi:general secretion pathway protein H